MMKDYDIAENGIHIKFRITDEGKSLLLHCSNEAYDEKLICNRNEKPLIETESSHGFAQANFDVFTPIEIELSGGQFNDHHGAKKCKSDVGESLRFEFFRQSHEKEGTHIVLGMQNSQLKAECHYQLYNGIPIVRSYTKVTALQEISLEYLSSFKLMGIGLKHGKEMYNKVVAGVPHNAWHGEGQWHFAPLSDCGLTACHDSFYMKKLSYGNVGSWSSKEYLPSGIICDDDSLIFWQIEHNGSWYSEIGNMRSFLYLQLYGPTFAEAHWIKKLEIGESFTSVPVALAFTKDLNLAIQAMTVYRRNIVFQHPSDANLPSQYNDYMHANWANPTSERLFEQIDAAAKIGVEYFIIDAGWYSDTDWWDSLGEWKEAKNRYKPYTLLDIFQFIKKKGMKNGLWLEIESVGVNCSIVKDIEHLLMTRFGKLVKDHDRYFLDFSLPQTQEYATGIVGRLVNEYEISYIKMDYNVDCSVGCDNNAESFGQGLYQHNVAYLKWIAKIQTKFPDLIIENCASGGMRLDYASLSQHTIANTSDQIFYNRNPYILCNLAASILPEQIGAWCYPRKTDTREQIIINLVNAMLFRIQLSGQIESLTQESTDLIIEGLAVYHTLTEFKRVATVYLPHGMVKFFDENVFFALKHADKLLLCAYNLHGKKQIEVHFNDFDISQPQILFPTICETVVKCVDEHTLKIDFENDECGRVISLKIKE